MPIGICLRTIGVRGVTSTMEKSLYSNSTSDSGAKVNTAFRLSVPAGTSVTTDSIPQSVPHSCIFTGRHGPGTTLNSDAPAFAWRIRYLSDTRHVAAPFLGREKIFSNDAVATPETGSLSMFRDASTAKRSADIDAKSNDTPPRSTSAEPAKTVNASDARSVMHVCFMGFNPTGRSSRVF